MVQVGVVQVRPFVHVEALVQVHVSFRLGFSFKFIVRSGSSFVQVLGSFASFVQVQLSFYVLLSALQLSNQEDSSTSQASRRSNQGDSSSVSLRIVQLLLMCVVHE